MVWKLQNKTETCFFAFKPNQKKSNQQKSNESKSNERARCFSLLNGDPFSQLYQDSTWAGGIVDQFDFQGDSDIKKSSP